MDNVKNEKITYKIAIYTRISKKDELKNQNESIKNQKNIIKSFIYDNDCLKNSSIFYYSDIGYSGNDFERPAFKQLLEDIKSKKINCIIVKDLSRFGRNYIQINEYLDKIFPLLNIRFIAINDDYDSINNKNISLNMDISFKNIIYSYYIKDLSKKVKASFVSKAKQGDYIYGFAPFGYKKNIKTRRLEIDEETAPIVKMVFNLVEEGKTYAQVCNILNENNIPTKSYFKAKNNGIKPSNNTIWKRGAIYQIISNQVYIGNTVNFKRKRKYCGNNKKIIKSQNDEIIIIENTHQPLISKEVFLKLNNKNLKINNKKNSNIFAYKIKCANCGYSLRNFNIYKNNKNIGKKYYCNTKNEYKNSKCFKDYILEEDLINIVFESLKNIIFTQEIVLKNNKNQLSPEKYKPEIIKLNLKKRELYEKYLENKINKNEYIKQKTQIDNEIIKYKNKSKQVQVYNIKENNTQFEFNQFIVNSFIKCIYVYNKNTIEIKFYFKKFF